jgi:D-alanyl-D-alanine carboxypeptidase
LAPADKDQAPYAKMRSPFFRTLDVSINDREEGRTMKSFTNRMSFAACVLTLAGAVGCDGSSTPAPAHNTRVEAGLQRVLDQAEARQDVRLPGAIADYRDPAHAPWSGCAGVRELQAGTPLRPDHRFRAGSILKTFLATVTLQLVEEGALSLDQTLPELLPSTVADGFAKADQITLRMLLNHTSGIPEWTSPDVDAAVAADPSHIWTPDEILGIATSLPATSEPGASWHYSNTNYTLLGMVLDRAGGMSWRAQVRARLLAPLRLTSTRLPEPGDRAITADYAHGYQDAGGTAVDLSFVDPSMAGAAGGNAMVTTVQDLATFIEALLAGRLFTRPGTLAEMTTMVEAPDGSGFPHWYGLGLESYELGGTTVVGNAGGAAGYATFMYRIPARDTTLVTSITTSDLFANAVNVLIPSLDVIAAPAQ